MRSFLVMLSLALSVGTALPFQYSVRNAPPVPPATANDLLRAQRLAEKAKSRLEQPHRPVSSWAHGPAAN
jgi:hypothetical protein